MKSLHDLLSHQRVLLCKNPNPKDVRDIIQTIVPISDTTKIRFHNNIVTISVIGSIKSQIFIKKDFIEKKLQEVFPVIKRIFIR